MATTILVLYSCSTLNVPSGKKVKFYGIATSADGRIHIPLPRGWFSADSSSIAPLSFLIIKRDGSASISFTLINLETKAEKINLSKTFEYVKSGFLTDNKHFISLSNNSEFFKAGEKECRAIVMKNGNNFVRLVVFKFKNKYFQSILHYKSNPERNVFIQNKLIEKLELKI